MATLYVLMGFPCTGKTTYARAKNVPVIEADEVRKTLTGSYESDAHSSLLVADVVYQSVQHHLENGNDVAVEGLFASVASRHLFIELARKTGARIEMHWFDPGLRWIRERLMDANYPKPHVTPAYIDKLSHQFEWPTSEERFDAYHYYTEDDLAAV